MYKEITTVEEAMKRYKEPFDLEKMKEAVSVLPPSISRGMLALAVLQVVTWSVNNDDPKEPEFKPDYNNSDQYKWSNWFRGGDETGSGFRFFDAFCDWANADTRGGARLACKDEERALHVKQYFEEQYKELFLILK
jgi:hypothetical protein